jgi:hypothetical protein
MHGYDVPALYPLARDRATLGCRLEAAVDRMLDFGGDGLSLELVVAEAIG